MRPFGKDCLLSILVELSIVAFIAAFLPLLIRYAALPTSVHHQYPLNVVFRTCDHDLHSVCSFPSATLEYEKNSLFSPNVAYYLNVRLKFADIASSKKLGFFQSVISITEENGKVVQQYTKSAYVKEPGLITKASQVFLFPLYILGYLYDYSTLTISMSENYLEQLGSPSTKLIFTVQDKFANIEEAELTVTARFGLIRHLIYYWPVMSYTAMFASFSVFGVFLIVLKIGYLEYRARQKAAIEKNKMAIVKTKQADKKVKEELKEEVKKEIPKENLELRKRK
ncbi:hypothetical protein L5515_008333 [Caenorhabditis briggsae]|uniref:Seipin n=1 Tax=Caenorhabditis briggsae TaxID=6238 RepID=A0AAE9A7C6_CAEBR|nr:hypothetical protein L3Y34_008489 [Caenorhabditis briggsae]UMM35948.1 hypothetical protein L5515_008333 [Caenorhabditis briggsae]